MSCNAHDPDASPLATPNFKRTALSLIPPASVFAQAGAAGYIVTLDASAANAAGTYGPYGSTITGLPGLLIDRDTDARLRRYAQTSPKARLTLTASVTKSSTPQLVGILPGDGSTDEVMVVNTHTDGMNAFEENGGIGLVWLARYFSQLPKGRRLKRSLVFSAVSGHFAGPALPQTRGFIDRHPDLLSKAAASITVEHLGAGEWVDDARHGPWLVGGWPGGSERDAASARPSARPCGSASRGRSGRASRRVRFGAAFAVVSRFRCRQHPTGRPDMFVIWHSQTGIAGPVVESMIANDLRHSIALRPAGDYMIAVGTAFNESGVPPVSSIVAPTTWSPGPTTATSTSSSRPRGAGGPVGGRSDHPPRLDPGRAARGGGFDGAAHGRRLPSGGEHADVPDVTEGGKARAALGPVGALPGAEVLPSRRM